MEPEPRLSSCAQLQEGRRIEARRRGITHFTGTVEQIMPSAGLFWAVSEIGEHRIIEFAEYEVYPSAAPRQ